jgi:cell wall-associated NlpC family hydrolase
MDWLAEYVGIPFEPHGRTRAGCDCYGLVRLVLAEHFGKTLPSFDDGYDDFADRENEARLINAGLALINAERVNTPAPGDIVQLRWFGDPSHVGLYVGHGRMLHIEQHNGFSSIVKLDSIYIRSRIVGYFRLP